MLVHYPEIKPYQRHQLKVDDVHELYLDESGSPDGVPVVFVHGGPGAGCDAFSRRYFDPDHYRIITFDQRGAGRSTPHAELKNNTTADLIEDLEKVREHLGIDRWVLFGGSWGSTLSLLYAQQHPDKVMGLVLRGIFLCRKEDLQWFYQLGASHIFPDYWEDFVHPVPEEERDDFISAYYKILTGDNELASMSAAKAWSMWEGRCATLKPSHKVVDHFSDPHRAKSIARIEAHYFVNDSFIDENQVLSNMDKIADIPGIIVHGRYDMVCPLDNAFKLHQKWPNSELHIVREAGHMATEPSIVDALIRASRDMARRFRVSFDDAE